MSEQIARKKPKRSGWLALLPLVVLIVTMCAVGIYAKDFYSVPMILVFLVVSIVSLFTLRGYKIEERLNIYSQGAGQKDLLLMVWIFVMAGAFAKSAQQMGAVSATVDLTIFCLPNSMLLGSLFISACIVSLCMGTSVGTIVALVPVATEMATRIDMPIPLMVASVVGGSFFGDNLSFISDTTVAATRTQGCTMQDKFRTNFKIVLPVAIVCFIVYVIIGIGGNSVAIENSTLYPLKMLPYIVVIVLAIYGVNVLLSLFFGVLMTGAVGYMEGTMSFEMWIKAMSDGIMGMGELILISMMAGGLLMVIRKAGGITYLVRMLTRMVVGRRGAEFCIAGLVVISNVCTANNTVAILSVGPIAKDISRKFKISAQRTASLLDIFSCVVQGVIPYGAQLLMAGGLAMISPLDIIPYLFYPMLLCAFAVLGIIFPLSIERHPKK